MVLEDGSVSHNMLRVRGFKSHPAPFYWYMKITDLRTTSWRKKASLNRHMTDVHGWAVNSNLFYAFFETSRLQLKELIS